MKRKIIYPLICLLTAIIWGSGFPFQEMAGNNAEIFDGFMFNGLRFLLGGIVVIPVFLLFEKEREIQGEARKIKLKNTVIYGIISGVILATSSVLQQFGIQLTGESGKAGFITGLYLIIVPIGAFILFRQKASLLVWISLPIAVVGLYFLSITSEFTIKTGDILSIIDGKISFTGQKPYDVLLSSIEKIADDDTAVITVFCGEEVTKEEESKLKNALLEEYEDCDITVTHGGQPVYQYIASAE